MSLITKARVVNVAKFTGIVVGCAVAGWFIGKCLNQLTLAEGTGVDPV